MIYCPHGDRLSQPAAYRTLCTRYRLACSSFRQFLQITDISHCPFLFCFINRPDHYEPFFWNITGYLLSLQQRTGCKFPDEAGTVFFGHCWCYLPHHMKKKTHLVCRQVQQDCANCGACLGKYFCAKCNFFDDDVSSPLSFFF